MPAERGNYNMANTSTVDAQGNIASTIMQNATNPISVVGGDGRGYGGFAPGEARAYLDKMAAQDAQERAIRANEKKDGMATMLRIGLQREAQSNNAYTRRAAQAELSRLDADQQARAAELAATQRTGLQAAADLQHANTQGQFGLQQEAMRGENALVQADLTGQYGLAGREAIAQSRILAEQVAQQSPTARLAAAREQQLQMQAELMRQAQAAGDVGGVFAAAGLSRPSTPEYIDPLTGAPLTPDLIEILQAQTRARLSPQR
jgi:hypothetical protein